MCALGRCCDSLIRTQSIFGRHIQATAKNRVLNLTNRIHIGVYLLTCFFFILSTLHGKHTNTFTLDVDIRWSMSFPSLHLINCTQQMYSMQNFGRKIRKPIPWNRLMHLHCSYTPTYSTIAGYVHNIPWHIRGKKE